VNTAFKIPIRESDQILASRQLGNFRLEIAELKTRAWAFLDKHPEIIARAAKTVRNDPALRRMAQRHGSLQ
jgi:hypothetical protein